MHTRLAAVLLPLAAVATFVSLLWATACYLNFYRNAEVVAAAAADYRAAVFVVEQTRYQPAGPKRGPQWSATGTVDGHPETFNLAGVVSGDPGSAGALERQLPRGTRIPVMYNPTLEESGIAGRTTRVQPPSADFVADRRASMERWWRFTFLPPIVSGGVLLFVVGLRRSRA